MSANYADEIPDDQQFGLPDESPPPAAPVDYTIRWDADRRKRLAARICHEIRRYREAVQPRLDLLATWRRDWELQAADVDPPWDGAANVPSSLTRSHCDNHSTRLNQQIIHSTPPLTVKARKREALEVVSLIEDVLESVLEEAEWQQTAVEAHQELAIGGNVFIRVTHEDKVRRRPEHEVVEQEENLAALVAAGVPPPIAMFDALKRDRRGRVTRYLQWRWETYYSGIEFKVIPFEDGVILPATIRDPEQAYGIGEKLTLRGDELLRGVKQKRYFRDAVMDLLTRPSDDPDEYQVERLDAEGIDTDTGDMPTLDGETEVGGNVSEVHLYRQYECYNLCWQGDFNGDGEMEWAVVTVHEPSETILGLRYLDYAHGQPYYSLLRYIPRVRQLFGQGIAEMLELYHDADAALLNDQINHADLVINMAANFFYDKSAGFNPDKWEFKLGRPIPVTNVRGILPIPVPPFPAEHTQLVQQIKDRTELLTASSNPSLGKATDTQKTLGEVQIVMGASNLKFEELAAKVALQWAKVWDQVRWLVAQYGEGGEVPFRKVARPGATIQTEDGQSVPAAMVGGQLVAAEGGFHLGTVPAELLQADVDLVPTGLAQLSDLQTRITQATLVQQLLLQHPLTAQDMETQKIALDAYLQAFRYPQREKIMERVEQVVQARMQAMQQAAVIERQGLQQGAMVAGALQAAQGAAPPQEGVPPEMGGEAPGAGGMPPAGGAPPMARGMG